MASLFTQLENNGIYKEFTDESLKKASDDELNEVLDCLPDDCLAYETIINELESRESEYIDFDDSYNALLSAYFY